MAKGDFAKAGFMNLPPWAKGVIAIGVLGGIGYLVYKIIKIPKDVKEGQGNRQEDRGWNKELDKLNSNPATKATMTQVQMLSYANSLQAAMAGIGTNEASIVATFKAVKNDADFAGISAAYGVRTINSGVWGMSDYSGTLAGALESEVSQYWKDLINKDLASKKVTFKL